MFGSEKRRYKKMQQVEDQYRVIGRDGAPDTFLAANTGAWDALKDMDLVSYAALGLLAGAKDAFNAGRPENLQAYMVDPSSFKYSYPRTAPERRREVIQEITKGSSDPTEAIQELLAQIPADKMQNVLDTLLYAEAMQERNLNAVTMAALVVLGANPAALIDGKEGRILLAACAHKAALPVVKMLVEHGATFDATLFMMKIEGYSEDTVKRVEAYRDQIVGTPAAQNAAKDAKIDQLMEMVHDLTQKVGHLESGQLQTPPAPANDVPPSPLATPSRITAKKILGGP
jgi:hypothetical protein